MNMVTIDRENMIKVLSQAHMDLSEAKFRVEEAERAAAKARTALDAASARVHNLLSALVGETVAG